VIDARGTYDFVNVMTVFHIGRVGRRVFFVFNIMLTA
jgi:hypothetical protein